MSGVPKFRNFTVSTKGGDPKKFLIIGICMRKPTMWILTRSNTNQAVQPLEIAKGLKFCMKEVEVLYDPSSENKGADQLRSYREADLCLCFRICKTLIFSRRSSNF